MKFNCKSVVKDMRIQSLPNAAFAAAAKFLKVVGFDVVHGSAGSAAHSGGSAGVSDGSATASEGSAAAIASLLREQDNTETVDLSGVTSAVTTELGKKEFKMRVLSLKKRM